jgi:hypothetical protein
MVANPILIIFILPSPKQIKITSMLSENKTRLLSKEEEGTTSSEYIPI